MNIFVAIMLFFAALGLVDKILGGRLGLAEDFDRGLETMGGLALSTVGFYSIGVSYVQTHAGEIAGLAENLPFDPSLIPGCLLAPDMGALGIALRLAATPALAAFTGALVSGGLGATIGYQLPVFLAAVKREEIPELMRGFIFGLITLPAGLLVGGLLIGLTPAQLFFNLIPVLLLCVFLIAAFLLVPSFTMRFLIVLGNAIRIVSFVFFAIAAFGVFMPERALVDPALASEMLSMVLRMVVVACGGLVLSHLALEKLSGPIRAIGERMGVNNESVIGLVLSATQSLAMLPLFSSMDRRGRIINAAFSVAGAYIIGGQMSFVASLVTPGELSAYMLCKLISGVLAVAAAILFDRGKN